MKLLFFVVHLYIAFILYIQNLGKNKLENCGKPIVARVCTAFDTSILKETNSTYHYDTITVFSQGFDAPLSSPFVIAGSLSYHIRNSKIRFSGSSNSYANYLYYSKGTMVENAIMEATIILNKVGNNDFGIAIGFQSYNVYCCFHHVRGEFCADINSPNYKQLIISHGTPLGKEVSPQTLSFSAGDTLHYKLIRNGINYTFSVTDLNSAQTVSYNVNTLPTGVPFAANNSAYPALWHLGGDFSVLDWTYKIIKPHSVQFAINGNSITYGQAASSAANRYAQQVGDSNLNMIQGGGADVTQSLLTRLDELIMLSPKYVLLMLGGNDIFFGVPSTTWQKNLKTIRDTLTAHGIQIIHLLPTPRNGTDVTPLRNFLLIEPAFAKDKKIDLFTALLGTITPLNPMYDSGDGTHPNDTGMARMAATINDSLQRWHLLTIP